jgi:protein involved in polysaccharide export with SLBB domain
MNSLFRAALAALFLAALLPHRAASQTAEEWDAGRTQLSRASLEELLARFEQTSGSAEHTSEFRARARYEAALVRARLRDGDFQVGDQIILRVEGEQALSDSFVVTPQRTINLPVIGEIPLTGVLRSELQGHLTTQIGRQIRDPVVRANSSIRVLVSGEVARPGYYVVDTQSLLSDVLMLAGGPGPSAKLTAMRVERRNEPIWEGEALQEGIAEGRTLDQLSLRAGDHLVVPAEGERGMSTVTRILFTGIPALTLALTTLAGIF